MSRHEQHPIDDHFRRSLAGAEVEPPAHVWAAVAAAQGGSGRRWGLLIWPLLVLFGVGLAGAFHFFGTADGTSAGSEFATVEGQEATSIAETKAMLPVPKADAVSDPRVIGAAVDGQVATGIGPEEAATRAVPRIALAEEEPVPEGGATTIVSAAQGDLIGVPAAIDPGGSFDTDLADRHVSPHSIGKPDHAAPPSWRMGQAALATMVDEHSAWAAGLPLRLEWMSIRPSSRETVEHARVLYCSNPAPTPYVLPRSEWWIGPAAGVFSTKLRWKGDDRELAEAIDRTTATRTEPMIGLAIGRTWRSGWGISSGLFWQQGEQLRRLSDRRTEVEQEIINRVVTLDAQVFVSSTDTIITTTTTETEFSGVERSAVLRIPLQAHWHGNLGRLLYGAQLGLVLERSSFRGGPRLVRNASDGRIVPVPDADASRQDRIPLSLSIGAGLDIGYQLHERWALRAGPMLMHGLAPLQRTNDVFALPDRIGFQFLLAHHIHRRSYR